jgi:C1A family cysteine protease
MKILFFLISCISAFNLRSSDWPADNKWPAFIQYQKDFAKSYSSLDELELRFFYFKNNLFNIMNHNLDKTHTFQMGVNRFSDLSEIEFQLQFTGGFAKGNSSSINDSAHVQAQACSKFPGTGKALPSAVDWASKSTAVKDQGYCGSCWSFSAVETIESAWAIKKNQLLVLSEQQLVDCSKKYGNMACNGGLMDNAFHYVMDNGICSETSYPYTSGKTTVAGTCQSCPTVASIIGCSDVSPNNQLALKEAVSNGPVSIAIQADSKIFQSYTSGIITGPSCGQTLDHGVVITGYGIENNIKYWKVRNSWSANWGEAGYVRIERSDSTNDAGTCGIAMQPSFPIV